MASLFLCDLTIFINLSPEDAFKRKKGADENDRLEQAGLAFHQRVYEGYLDLAKKDPEHIVTVDGKGTPEQIFAEVLQALKAKNCL